MEDVANNLVSDARRFAAAGCYRNAFNLYLTAIEKSQAVRRRVEFEFRIVLTKLNQLISRTEHSKHDIMYNLQHAVRLYPGSGSLLADIGDYFFRYGCFIEALCHYEKALSIDSSLVRVESSMNDAKRMIFDPNHFRLFNDKARNAAYATAIYMRTLPRYDRVLDLDSGPGLSALTAHACHPLSTAAANRSATMTQLVQNIVNEHNYREILLLDKPLAALSPPEIYGERTIVVINDFDAGLFTNNMLYNLRSAHENLMSRYARVLPCRAEYFVMGVRSSRISAKYRLRPSLKKRLNLGEANVNCLLKNQKSFYTEDLDLYGDDVEYVTDEKLVLMIFFERYEDVMKKIQTSDPYDINIVAKDSGVIDVLVGWFNIYLTEDIVLTNDPRCPNKSPGWPQAVFPEFIPKEVQENDNVLVQFLTHEGKLSYFVEPDKTPRISLSVVRFLNDTVFMDAIAGCVPAVTAYLAQLVDIAETNVVDLSPFPWFALLMLLRGARYAVCHAENMHDKIFIKSIFKKNNISKSKYTVMLGECWAHECFHGRLFHAIFCTELSVRGDIDAELYELVERLRIGHLAAGGLLLPMGINMMVQLVTCKQLDVANKLFDENFSGFRLASYVNKYQVTQVADVDLSLLEYEELSEPILLTNCCNLSRATVIQVEALKDGECTAVITWFTLRLFEHNDEISTKRVGAFMDSYVYLPTPTIQLNKGDVAKVMRVIEQEGLSKIMIDPELC